MKTRQEERQGDGGKDPRPARRPMWKAVAAVAAIALCWTAWAALGHAHPTDGGGSPASAQPTATQDATAGGTPAATDSPAQAAAKARQDMDALLARHAGSTDATIGDLVQPAMDGSDVTLGAVRYDLLHAIEQAQDATEISQAYAAWEGLALDAARQQAANAADKALGDATTVTASMPADASAWPAECGTARTMAADPPSPASGDDLDAIDTFADWADTLGTATQSCLAGMSDEQRATVDQTADVE